MSTTSSSSAPLCPLSTASVLLVLDLISPPSLLLPLPSHLLSSSLRQRHHFLDISPDNPIDYLTWPTDSASRHRITTLLESLPRPNEHLDYPVRYSADAESVFAHAAIPSDDPPGFRVIFQWESGGWKYHNIALMPFPQETFESIDKIEDVMSFKPHDFLTEAPAIITDDDDNSYWDAYDDDDDDDGDTRERHVADTETNEDAYWARYSSVHGSADSAIPTPPRIDSEKQGERVMIPIFDDRRRDVYNPLEPPSPHTLARCLADIPPRPETPPLDSDSCTGSSFTPPISSLSPATYYNPGTSSLEPDPSSSWSDIDPKSAVPSDELDARSRILKDAIRGVYHLWKLGRHRNSLDEGEVFMDMVRQVIAESTSGDDAP